MDEHNVFMAEALAEDEGLTDGLTDMDAVIIMDWSFSKVEAFSGDEKEAEKYLKKVKKTAKIISETAQVFIESQDYRKAQRLLSQIWDDKKVKKATEILIDCFTIREVLVELLSLADKDF